MIYDCCDENRRAATDAHPILNGIDWLEVVDSDAPAGSPRQRTLIVRLLKPVPADLGRENVRIRGGERIRNIDIVWVAAASAPPADKTSAAEQAFFAALSDGDHILLVRTGSAGDFSTYRLALTRGRDDERPPERFDPRLVEVEFRFKVECPSDFDCKPAGVCEEPGEITPDIDYLAKDYASFRRLVLDRLTRFVPGWRERSAADVGITLAELMAYAADHLSYWQDAVATEAYLGTARRRTSLRRHALLVDYAIQDGCNARVWLQVRVSGGPVEMAMDSMRFYTRTPAAPKRIVPDSQEERDALLKAPLVFEPMHDAVLREEHNDLYFYTWGDARCCLVAGATSATLRGHHPDLAVGDVLVFQESKGPLTGDEDDADPAHRQAVRLTIVQAFEGTVPLVDPLTGDEITEIAWHSNDALRFPLCLSSQTDEDHGAILLADVSTALGNIILADHGLTVENESLGAVPGPILQYPPEHDAGHCEPGALVPLPPRFRPTLAERLLTQAGTVLKTTVVGAVREIKRVRFDPDAAAAAALLWEMRDVIPDLWLASTLEGVSETWTAKRDLLSSGATDLHFVAETESDGTATLRFGDDVHGARPDQGTEFAATYRTGNGLSGNVGTEAIAQIVSDDGRIVSVANPMPASGGVDPESLAQVRRRAPQAFRTQERAVTPDDYEEVTERADGVQRASASLRWTGSWHTVFIAVDPVSGEPLGAEDREALEQHVDRYRMAGHDLRFHEPRYASLEIEVTVCVARDYFRGDVQQRLLEVLGSGPLPDGRKGVFHPDNLSFGQTVYLSRLYAVARRVAGVDSVRITRFQRQGQVDAKPLDDGFMTFGALEIPRLANDPNFPEHGVLRLLMFGGK